MELKIIKLQKRGTKKGNSDFLGLVNKWIELGSNSGKIKKQRA